MDLQVDETGWPIVTARWTTMKGGDLGPLLSRMDAWLARGERFGFLLDSRGAGALSPDQRVKILDHMKANAALTKQFLVQAVVIDNLVQRTLFYAVSLVFPHPFPSRVFAEPKAAREWLESVVLRGR
jgi:hypothetical protein